MIQRIQTFFLAMAFIGIGLLLWFSLGDIAVHEKIYSFSLKGIVDTLTGKTLYSAWHLIVLTGMILFIQVIVLFSYNNRKKQIRLTTLNIFLMAGFVIVCWLFVKLSTRSLGDGVYSLKASLIFPIVSIFFNYLAIRAIKRDEALVKSVDRIR
jgi:hypothetical protein